MNQAIKKQLGVWADRYETPDFIPADPIQFPHRFSLIQDIEIAGLLTAWISFGNRKMILRKAEEMMQIMHQTPYQYILSREWEYDFPASEEQSFYRTFSKKQMHLLMHLLFDTYTRFHTLEEALLTYSGTPRERLFRWLSVSEKSPQKKLNMFLRWMIRKNSPVDLGVWHYFDAKDLVIPLDTHVTRVAHEIGLTEKATYSLRQAMSITNALEEIFPGDPCRGDFALFGYGVQNNPIHHIGSTSK